MRLSNSDINEAIEAQLNVWPECKQRFIALGNVRRKLFRVGDLDVAVQHNPARAKSTNAKVDAKSIADRPCFLCAGNRPELQLTEEFPEGWDFLINPFPIFPVHFTIASKKHEPQGGIPLDMVTVCDTFLDLVCFYNGARAGASAPDHLHFQAVLKTELPLIKLVEERHQLSDGDFATSLDLGLDLPFVLFSAIITPDAEGMNRLRTVTDITGFDVKSQKPDAGLINAYFWIDNSGFLRTVVIPRAAHRPDCYFAEGTRQLKVSPGAVDMAGVIIVTDEDEFDRISGEDIDRIYRQTGLDPTVYGNESEK